MLLLHSCVVAVFFFPFGFQSVHPHPRPPAPGRKTQIEVPPPVPGMKAGAAVGETDDQPATPVALLFGRAHGERGEAAAWGHLLRRIEDQIEEDHL